MSTDSTAPAAEKTKETPPSAPPDGYGALDSDRVHDTIRVLSQRISERFPGSGLSRVCSELQSLSSQTRRNIRSIQQPIWSLRLCRYGLLALILAGLIFTAFSLRPDWLRHHFSIIDIIQTLEAGINDVVLISIAVFFIWSIESRVKRHRALRSLHQLRSIAHVIDMHQLTKDPDRFLNQRQDTASSPKMQTVTTAFGLRRYLDYCSEMLSLIGKVAAIYLEKLHDPTVVATVNEIEELTTGLSGKIWQKIDMLRDEND